MDRTPRKLSFSNHSSGRYLLLLVPLTMVFASTGVDCPAQFVATDDPALAALFEPAPRRALGTYDFFGKALSQSEARQMVVDAGLDPENDDSYLRLGLIHYTQALIDKGRIQFLQSPLGDPFSINNIISFASEYGKSTVQSALDSFDPANDPDGSATVLRDILLTCLLRPKEATTNLEITLSRDLKVGTKVIPAGTVMRTGLDVQAGNFTPVGFDGGAVSCAICHASVDVVTGREVVGRANTDLDIGLFLALSPNSAGAFVKVTAPFASDRCAAPRLSVANCTWRPPLVTERDAELGDVIRTCGFAIVTSRAPWCPKYRTEPP